MNKFCIRASIIAASLLASFGAPQNPAASHVAEDPELLTVLLVSLRRFPVAKHSSGGTVMMKQLRQAVVQAAGFLHVGNGSVIVGSCGHEQRSPHPPSSHSIFTRGSSRESGTGSWASALGYVVAEETDTGVGSLDEAGARRSAKTSSAADDATAVVSSGFADI